MTLEQTLCAGRSMSGARDINPQSTWVRLEPQPERLQTRYGK